MPVNAKQKGARGEREAVQFLRWCGFEAHRGRQYRGGPDSPDVCCESLPHVEVKRNQEVQLDSKALEDAMIQAYEESPDGNYLVLWRPDRKEWRVTWCCGFYGVPVTVAGNERVRQTLIKMATR